MYDTHNFEEGAELTASDLNDMDKTIKELSIANTLIHHDNEITEEIFQAGLKKYGLNVDKGSSSKGGEFLKNAETIALLKYWVTKKVLEGMRTGFSDLFASETISPTGQYLGMTLDDTAAYTVTTQANTLPTSSIMENSKTTVLSKYARLLNMSYEAFSGREVGNFGVMMQSIGLKLGVSVMKKFVECLEFGAEAVPVSTLTFEGYASLFGSFDCFGTPSTSKTAIIASPELYAQLLKIGAVKGLVDGAIRDIAGNKVIVSSAAENDTIIGFDTEYAVEFIHQPFMLEFDKMIDRDLIQFTPQIICGFRKITPDAVKLLVID